MISKFDDDVMVTLVKYCHDMGKLGLNYVRRVAESWHLEGIRTAFDLEHHMEERDQLMAAKKKIQRMLGRSYPLTEPEERYVKLWLNTYKYGLDIIEMAVQKTTSRPNANFEYLNGILKNWYEAGYKTKDEITAKDVKAKRPRTTSASAGGNAPVARRDNFTQREYDDDFFDRISNAALKGTKESGEGGQQP